MKSLIVILALLNSAHALTGKEIVDKSIHLDGGRSFEARTKIMVTEEEGKTKSKDMWVRKKKISGEDSTRIEFTSPADIKGMALLMIDQKDGETDQHLYVPALRRIRRIRGSLKSQDFADTDFSYEDMEKRNLDNAEFDLKGEEPFDGASCYKIESKTKKGARSQYGKTMSWIDKNTFLLKKMDLYDREGKQIKTLRSLDAKEISGVWTEMKLEMENLEKKRKTTYEVQKIAYDVNLDSNLFTTATLGQ